MTHRVYLALACWLAVSTLVLADTGEPLHPAFTDEAMRDPFLTPAAISGPLDGEPLEDQWNLSPGETYERSYAPLDILQDSGASCTDTAAQSRPRTPFYDSGGTATYLSPVDGFGVRDVDGRSTLLIPYFIKGSPLRLAMGAGTTMISAPTSIDVPSQLYNFTAELRCLIPLRETWGIEVGAGGGVFSDLNGSIGDGFRVTGRAILIKDVNPYWKLSGGVLYLGRKNLPAMPIAGAIYTPRDDFKVEILIPRPRVMKRIALNGTREHWIYAGGEIFGGNTWAIQQSTGAQDTFIYKDNRLLVGYETKAPGRLAGRIEAGYVFMRKVSFTNDPTTLDPGGTVMLRAGVTY